MIGDAAYKKEDDTGHALRGSLYCRVALPSPRGREAIQPRRGCKEIAHLLDYACKSERHVTRSTFSAELFSACDTADHGLLLATIMHQIQTGACTVTRARELREDGGWAVQMILAVDAMSVFAAATATQIKIPALPLEKSQLSHVQYLRELLDRNVLDSMWWLDTRDMIADGLTKGAVDREALHQLMDGWELIDKEFKVWRSALANTARMLVFI